MEEEVLCQSSNGELLVFYVDEDGSQEEAIVTSIESIEQGNLQELQSTYLLGSGSEATAIEAEQVNTAVVWQDEEIKRLLIFYIDNKSTFQSGTTNRKHLWTVACKTMLSGKTPELCDITLESLKNNYIAACNALSQGMEHSWSHYDLCHQAFHDECQNGDDQHSITEVAQPTTETVTYTVNTYNTTKRSNLDETVLHMLTSYLNFKKRNPNLAGIKHFWENTALELGKDEDYWHKRFLNYKQHYIRMIEKRRIDGPDSVNWPYMAIFDEIYRGDVHFQKKYGGAVQTAEEDVKPVQVLDWNSAEMTVLAKYCFDCFDDFQDPKIPNGFLWNEIGRLLDRPSEMCKQKYETLKNEHLDQYIAGGYDIPNRIPIAILFDNILCKEVEQILRKGPSRYQAEMEIWKTEELDELVQFFYNNIELFKDPICHYVCWAAIGKKLHRNIHSLLNQWEDLTALYKSILNDKKENSDMEIDWRYIDMFDRIFDYGMDTKLLNGYEKLLDTGDKKTGNAPVKKVNIHLEEDLPENGLESEDDDDEKGAVKRSRGTGDKKQFQILEYYLKNKEKFATSQRKKLWQVLAEQIGISAEQCAHRFRNLKQVYTAYVLREIEKPEMPILWPYYVMCKKVFGYRLLKNKLKNAKYDKMDIQEWTPKEIKLLIKHFGSNYAAINENSDDTSIWASLSREIGKSETACRDKYLELRKSYRKVKTMMNRNPNCKVSWKYYRLFDEVCTEATSQQMEVDEGEFSMYDAEELMVPNKMPENNEGPAKEEEGYQCIIVLPEGQDAKGTESTGTAAKIEIRPLESDSNSSTFESKDDKLLSQWKDNSKRLLLVTYLNYITTHKGKTIDSREMWSEIAKKFPKRKVLSCKRLFYILMRTHKKKVSENDEEYKKSHFYELLEKIIEVNPKIHSTASAVDHIELEEKESYPDVILPTWKVAQALNYYLEHIEEFTSPKYVKKFIWNDLAKHSFTNITKIFNKINFLKQNYANTEEEYRDKLEFASLLKQIYEIEIILKIALENEPKPMAIDDEPETVWTDEEMEKLLNWYLANLDKFKNPKFVTSYLWMEAPAVLNKNALACSKKMSEIRTQYSMMVKENPDALQSWRFQELCQKIYGTGKRSMVNGD